MPRTEVTYSEARERAERVDRLIHERCKRIAREAGIDPTIYPIHTNNALVSYSQGKPWRGVDYRLIRKINWLETRRSRVWQLLDAYGRRYFAKHHNFD